MRRKARCLIAAAVAISLCSTSCSIHTVSVYSDPGDAQVLIDGEPIGQTTPAELRIKDLDYGSHKVTVQKPGYEMSGPAQELRIAFRSGLLLNSIFFFYTPFPWIKVYQTGYKAVAYPRQRVIPMFQLREIEASLSGPWTFEEAVRLAASELFTQIESRPRRASRGPLIKVVADPVIDSNTGEVTNVSRRIQELLQDEARLKFPRFVVAEMDSKNIDHSDYVVTGIIPLETYRYGEEKLRHLSLSVFERGTGRIVARSDVWIARLDVPFESTPTYRDSPMYMKDERVESLITTASATVGSLADRAYFDSLATAALLTEASKAYDQGDYALALALFAKAAERADGKVMRAYSGIYQSLIKLDRTEDAESVFGLLADLGIRNGDLGVKFLFNVDATDFFGGPRDQQQYAIWLRQIANTIAVSIHCVKIVGHASRSGGAEHNQALSLRRAELVQSKMEVQAAVVGEKTTAVGRGFEDNIIGTGSNDANDAIDRRVEFKLTRCGA